MQITPNLILINALVSVVIPILVALITKATAPASLKSWLALWLSVVAGVLTPLVTTSHIGWQAVAISIFQVFGGQAVSHVCFLKPVGVTGPTGLVATAVPGGLGVDPATEVHTPGHAAT